MGMLWSDADYAKLREEYVKLKEENRLLRESLAILVTTLDEKESSPMTLQSLANVLDRWQAWRRRGYRYRARHRNEEDKALTKRIELAKTRSRSPSTRSFAQRVTKS